MATRQAGYRKATGTHQDQSAVLERWRCNHERMVEKYDRLLYEHEHLREQYRELQLDYSHALARLWSMNAAMGR